MSVYGVDYYDPVEEEVRYLIVDADSEHEARQKAIQELRMFNIPKRNIRQIEELSYLNK